MEQHRNTQQPECLSPLAPYIGRITLLFREDGTIEYYPNHPPDNSGEIPEDFRKLSRLIAEQASLAFKAFNS